MIYEKLDKCWCPFCNKIIYTTDFNGDELLRGKFIQCGICNNQFILFASGYNNGEKGDMKTGNDIVVTDKDTAELITQAKIYIHTKKIASRMLEQQQEEFKSWGYPWDVSAKS